MGEQLPADATAGVRPTHSRSPRIVPTCADTVICMDEYLPADVTAQAQAISRRHAGPGDSLPRAEQYGDVTARSLVTGK